MNPDPRRSASRAIDPRLGPRGRIGLALLAVAIVAVLITARWLTPDPRGFGTHTQLGLGGCSFRVLTGKPCPSCGMTTAFAWSARGRPDRAWRANPAGAVLAPLAAALVPWLVASAVTARPRPFRSADGPLVALVLLAAALSLGSWSLRMLGIGI